jgi:hypothetical protein
MVVVPSLSGTNNRTHPICLLVEFNVVITEDNIATTIMPIRNEIIVVVVGTFNIAILVFF